jgi:hypothetical protein
MKMNVRAYEHNLEAACNQADREITETLEELEDELREGAFLAEVMVMKARRHHQLKYGEEA